MIYDMILDGNRSHDIRKALFERGIPIPGEYKSMRASNRHGMDSDTQSSCLWSSSILMTLLADERYTGTYITGKTKIAEVGSGRQIKLDESEWIKIPGKHPAIIARATFDEVQEKMKAFRRKYDRKPRKKREYPLKGKVFCGCCHYAMQREITKDPTYRCRHTKVNPNAECFNMTAQESALDRVLLTIIRKQIQTLLRIDETCELSASVIQAAQCQEHETRLSQLEDEKQSLYERFVLQAISKDEYLGQKAMLDEQLTRLRQQQIAAKEHSERMQATATRYTQLQAVAKETRYKHSLTRTLVDALIDRVLVYPDNHIEIVWRFEDFAEAVSNSETVM